MDTRHPSEETLYAFVDAQLDAEAAAGVARHIERCGACAAIAAEARGFAAAATRIVGALDGAPANVIPVRRTRSVRPWMAAAAVVVLAVGVSSVVIRSGFESVATTEAARSAQAVSADAAQESAELSASAPAVGMASAPEVEDAPAGRAQASAGARRTRESSVDFREGRETRAADVAADQVAAPAVSMPAPAPSAPPAVPVGQAPPPGARRSATEETAAPLAGTTAVGAQRQRTESLQLKVQPTGARVAAAAPNVVSGRVLSGNGSPISGASVFVDELNVSTETDRTGRYELTIPAATERAIVRARAIGYAPQSREIPTAGRVSADFTLTAERAELSEVLVTGAPNAETRARADARAGAPRDPTAPLRVVRYRAQPGIAIELREFSYPVDRVETGSGENAFIWTDDTRTRYFVLTGPLSRAELEGLARRLGSLQVIR